MHIRERGWGESKGLNHPTSFHYEEVITLTFTLTAAKVTALVFFLFLSFFFFLVVLFVWGPLVVESSKNEEKTRGEESPSRESSILSDSDFISPMLWIWKEKVY